MSIRAEERRVNGKRRVAKDRRAAGENHNKTHFVSVVSHEFRTVLTGIQGFSEMIRDEDLSAAEIRDYAGTINRDAQRLAGLINEMVDLEHMESGRMALASRPIDLAALGMAALDAARMTSSRHEFRIQSVGDLAPVHGDPDKITQVMTYLLSNAVRYSPEGGEVTLTIQATAGGAEVSVVDHGLGIPEDQFGRIFERYPGFETGGRRRYVEGALPGLPTAMQIVEMHGGTMTVASCEGEGSTFTFQIPWLPS